MIEVIYKEEKQEAKGNQGVFSIPRNIRQIGLINKDYRIYVEDYVYTFLKKSAEKLKEDEEQKGCLAVLLGEIKWEEGISYIFIRGAIRAEDTQVTQEHMDFSQEVWAKIQEEEKTYFPDQEIVGWFLARQELVLEADDLIKRVHLKHFGGGEKVLMLMDPVEREDAFFRYENGLLVRQPGYYLYYEKNPMMQAYMVDKNQAVQEEQPEKVEDEAVKTFRKIIKAKKKEEEGEKTQGGVSVFSYAATACLVLGVLAVGAGFYRNYREIQNVSKDSGTAAAVSAEAAEDTGEESREEVTMVYPTVTPLVQPSETPSPTPAEEENQESAAVSQEEAGPSVSLEESETTEQTEQYYLEESDERKAKRRAELAQRESGQEEETAGADIHSSYVIKPGDTLYQISMEKYGSMEAIAEICELNGLSQNETIYPGQIIVLP